MSFVRSLLAAWLILAGLASIPSAIASAIAEPLSFDRAARQRQQHNIAWQRRAMAEIEARFAALPPGTPLRIAGVVHKPADAPPTLGLAEIYESARLRASAEVRLCGGEIALAGGPILAMYVTSAQLECIRRKDIFGRLQIDRVIPVPNLQ